MMPLDLDSAGDPFKVLGLPRRFDLTRPQIDAAYFARAARQHPDVAAGEAETLETSAALNAARRVLEDPERRADALLVLLGGPSKEQYKAMPPGFLARIMQTRQEIEESGASAEQAATWRTWAQERRREYTKRVGEMFRSLDPAPPAEHLAAIRVELNAWRYIERLIEQLGASQRRD